MDSYEGTVPRRRRECGGKACTVGTAQDVEAMVRELALAIIKGLKICVSSDSTRLRRE